MRPISGSAEVRATRRCGGIVAALAGAGLCTAALAQDLPQQAHLPLDLAERAAASALEACADDGYRVSVAVVDRDGTLKVLLRADGAGPHTTDSSFKKAYTAASLRRPTSEYARLVAETPEAAGLRDMNPNILILGGGLPVTFDSDVVGGIGVGGAPGGHFDEACARAGLDAIGAG